MNTLFWTSLRPQRQRLIYIFLASIVATGVIVLAAIAQSPVSTERFVPTITEEVGGAQVRLPDWDNISFSTLPSVLTGGEIGSQWNELTGYDLSRTWSEGDAVGEVIKLGDIAEGFSVQQFSLNDIAAVTGIEVSMESLPLDSFGLVGDQTLVELVAAMPELAEITIEDIAPIHDLVVLVGAGAWVEETLGSFINGNAIADELKLGGLEELAANLPPELAQIYNLDLANMDLGQYSISDIPGLSEVPFEDFARWENQYPSDIPGLVHVAFSQMPNGIANAGVIARVDTVMGEAEAEYQRTVSGSTEVGFSYPCATSQSDTEACAHIELDDIENVGQALQLPFEGRAWVSGATQKVPGGHGALKAMFGGKEPTGRHPFSDSFKVVVGKTDETSDTVQTLLYFRVCKTFLGCSPYGIGPVPFLTFKRDDYIVLGPPDFGGGSGGIAGGSSEGLSSGALDSGLGETGDGVLSGRNSASGSSLGRTVVGSNDELGGLSPEEYAQQSGIQPLGCTGEEERGINLNILSDAIAQEVSPDEGYLGVSASTGQSFKLGRYQYESDGPLVQDWVSRVAGGPDWLAELDKGHEPTRFDMEQYFPPMLQEELFKAEMRSYLAIASEEIDPQTGRVFSGSRLIERVVQIVLGGVGSVIDSTAQSGQGSTLYSYGKKVRTYYYGQGGQTHCEQET
ncbi:MAG: hypothetical protein AAGD25_15250 [Cyanobacteria bacterium P01_F01_bin.150]